MWDCKKCQERVEDSFELCWNCGTTKEGVEDPSFRPQADAEEVAEQEQGAEEQVQLSEDILLEMATRRGEQGQGAEEHVQPGGAAWAASRKRKPRSGPIVTTGNEVSGRQVAAYLGIVRGIVVRSPSIAQGFFGGLQQIVGGNFDSYAEVCEAARQEAFDRKVAHAAAIEADAVIAMRYDATEFSPGVTEVLAYGTAVKLA